MVVRAGQRYSTKCTKVRQKKELGRNIITLNHSLSQFWARGPLRDTTCLVKYLRGFVRATINRNNKSHQMQTVQCAATPTAAWRNKTHDQRVLYVVPVCGGWGGGGGNGGGTESAGQQAPGGGAGAGRGWDGLGGWWENAGGTTDSRYWKELHGPPGEWWLQYNSVAYLVVTHEALSLALQTCQEFSKVEVESFDLPRLTYCSCIQVGYRWFEPTGRGLPGCSAWLWEFQDWRYEQQAWKCTSTRMQLRSCCNSQTAFKQS